ncbi:dihydrodipicolinate synthase family protein [Salinibacterium sp. TMP30]|uniref:dihydrodipicolinate synthase family protein n=1 Tax=Salinibacterium sp. TMP30 TaxID=3138237 RepID=UPI00313A2DA0
MAANELLDQLHGVVPMLPTPFASDGSVDFAGCESLANFAEKHPAVALLGFGAECLTLTTEERLAVLRFFASARSAGRHIVAGCTAKTESEALRLVESANELGIHAVMVATPQQLELSEDAEHFFRRVIERLDETTLMVQDAPQWAGSPLGAETVRRLHTEFPEILRYAKPETVPYIDLMAELVRIPSLSVFAGLGGAGLLEALTLGATGVIPFSEAGVELARIFELPEQERGGRFADFLPLISFQFQSLEFAVQTSKALLGAQGVAITEMMRLPIRPMSDISRKFLLEHARRAHVLPS